jgi:hypothetical protein
LRSVITLEVCQRASGGSNVLSLCGSLLAIVNRFVSAMEASAITTSKPAFRDDPALLLQAVKHVSKAKLSPHRAGGLARTPRSRTFIRAVHIGDMLH